MPTPKHAGFCDLGYASALARAVFSPDENALVSALRQAGETCLDGSRLTFHRNIKPDVKTNSESDDSLWQAVEADGQQFGTLQAEGRRDGYEPCHATRLRNIALLLALALRSHLDIARRQSALEESGEKLRQQTEMLDQIQDSIVTMDLEGFITGWNKGAERLFGYSAAEAMGRNILFIYADADESPSLLLDIFLEDGGREMQVRRRKKNGDVFWASMTLSLKRDGNGNPSGVVGYLVDISDRLASEETLRLHSRIFELAAEAIVISDAEERIVSVNQAFVDITGYHSEEVIGRTPEFLLSADHDDRFFATMRESVLGKGRWQGETWGRRKNGDVFPQWLALSAVRDTEGRISHFFSIAADITERKQAEEQIYHLAYFDALTGLPNRGLLLKLIEQSLAEAHRHKNPCALLFIDIDRFKKVNDSLGHAIADELLRQIAARLREALRSEDVVARIGGDEFIVALFDITRRDHAGLVANKLLDALYKPFNLQGNEVLVSASIGVAVFPEDGKDAETMLRNADVAMFKAKQGGGNDFLYYASEMNMRSMERLMLENGMRRALEQEEFTLYYQPQVELRSGRIQGAEALIRWNHPQRGLVSPGIFIPLAEETGIIIAIGSWVIDRAARQIREWLDAGVPVPRISVNLSARQFRTPIPQIVEDALTRYNVDPRYFEVEITESMLMHSAEQIIEMMRHFRNMGVTIALDDFGTGYSSLSFIKRFPIDILKLDQSFVRGLPSDPTDSSIASAVLSLAKDLKLSVVAEGVESEEQLAFLRSKGCDEIQGYYFSPPVPADEFVTQLKRNGPQT